MACSPKSRSLATTLGLSFHPPKPTVNSIAQGDLRHRGAHTKEECAARGNRRMHSAGCGGSLHAGRDRHVWHRPGGAEPWRVRRPQRRLLPAHTGGRSATAEGRHSMRKSSGKNRALGTKGDSIKKSRNNSARTTPGNILQGKTVQKGTRWGSFRTVLFVHSLEARGA